MDNYSPVLHHEIRLILDEEDGDTSTRATGLSSQQIQEIVDQHNRLRAGEGASNMEVMVGDSSSATERTCLTQMLNEQFNTFYFQQVTWQLLRGVSIRLLQEMR